MAAEQGFIGRLNVLADLNRRREADSAEVGTGNSADRVASKFYYKDSSDSLRHLGPDQRIGLVFRQASEQWSLGHRRRCSCCNRRYRMSCTNHMIRTSHMSRTNHTIRNHHRSQPSRVRRSRNQLHQRIRIPARHSKRRRG